VGVCKEVAERALEIEEVARARDKLVELARLATPTKRDLVAAGTGVGATVLLLEELEQGFAIQQAGVVLGARARRALAAGTRPFTDGVKNACGAATDAACAVAQAVGFAIVAPPLMCAEVLSHVWAGCITSKEAQAFRARTVELARLIAPTKRDVFSIGVGLGAAVWMLDLQQLRQCFQRVVVARLQDLRVSGETVEQCSRPTEHHPSSKLA